MPSVHQLLMIPSPRHDEWEHWWQSLCANQPCPALGPPWQDGKIMRCHLLLSTQTFNSRHQYLSSSQILKHKLTTPMIYPLAKTKPDNESHGTSTHARYGVKCVGTLDIPSLCWTVTSGAPRCGVIRRPGDPVITNIMSSIRSADWDVSTVPYKNPVSERWW